MSDNASRVLDDDDVSFAITTDSGELERQGLYLVRSLRETYPNAPLLIFIPEDSVRNITDENLQYFRTEARVITGDIPIPEYPISALLRAFIEAEQAFNTEYIAALDTDALVFDNLRVSHEGDVWARPADVGAQYWGSEDSYEDWRALYRWFDLEAPDQMEAFSASVDNRSIPPYWNSGVVITTDRELPERWLEFTQSLYNENDLPVSTEEFFIDQISLALAIRNNEVDLLSERENHPLGGRLFLPSDVAVVHYGDRRNLCRILQPCIRSKIQSVGAIPNCGSTDILHSLLVLLSTKSGQILSYRQKYRLRSWFVHALPDDVID